MEITISQRIARASLSFAWKSLPTEVVKEAKRSFLDTLASSAGTESCSVVHGSVANLLSQGRAVSAPGSAGTADFYSGESILASFNQCH